MTVCMNPCIVSEYQQNMYTFCKEKKKEFEVKCPGVEVRCEAFQERTAKDTAIVSKTNIQKYNKTRKCPFTLSLYIISLYVYMYPI